MHVVILTCAGRSSRFPNHRAKWSLTHPTGHTMAAMSLSGLHLPADTRIVAAFNDKDTATYGLDALRSEFAKSGFEVQCLDVGETDHQVETVVRALRLANVEQETSVTVRDCDNFFRWEVFPLNRVAVVDLNGVDVPLVVRNKSYVELGANGITKLVEKEVISPYFCCGAYSFERASTILSRAPHERFLSQVVQGAIERGEKFKAGMTTDYEDWGTEQEWHNYIRAWRTLFVDIDGVLVEPSHRTFAPAWGNGALIEDNIRALNRLHETGRVEIILTTSRPEEMRAVTERQLSWLKYDRLIMGLRNCSRVIVNDSVGKRGQLTALAVNLERSSPMLGQMLASLP